MSYAKDPDARNFQLVNWYHPAVTKPSSQEETRVTDPNTGGQKGSKLAQLGFIDPLALEELAKVAGYGSMKYEKFNYLKGYDWSLSYNAAMRHAMQFWSGQDLDDETQLIHAAHAAWNMLALVSFLKRGLGNDDRFVQKKENEQLRLFSD